MIYKFIRTDQSEPDLKKLKTQSTIDSIAGFYEKVKIPEASIIDK